MKKIWILNHYATNMFHDHGGRHYYFAKYLIKAGYEVKIFCASTLHSTSMNMIDDGSLYYEKMCGEIPFVFVKACDYHGNGKKRVFNMMNFYYNVKKVARKQERPDIIIGSSVHPLSCVAAIKLTRYFKCKNIIEIRDLWPESIFAFGKLRENSLLGKLLIAGEYWIYKNANALVFLKEGDADYLKERKWTKEQGGHIDIRKCYYINNGVNIDDFNNQIKNEILEDIDLDCNKFNVVYTGSIRPVNNISNILDSAKLLKEKKEIQFLIYGDGYQLETLRQRVIEEELGNVKLKGYIDKKYMPYVLSKSSVNILNYSQAKYNWSRGNSSNKLFEYMASGKPIISTVKMGYCLITKYNCGLVLDKDTPKDLASNIMKIYEMPKDKYKDISTNAKNAAKDFDYQILTEKLVDVMKRVVS